MNSIAEKIKIDFTDDAITNAAGSIFLSTISQQLGLPALLQEQLRVKVRDRGATDAETMLALIYSLAQGEGCLADVDRLSADAPRQDLLGLEQVPDSRRLGEYLFKFDWRLVKDLDRICRSISAVLAPEVMDHALQELGYIPIFTDGSGIEVEGRYFEGAAPGYNGEPQYWLHSIFIGKLWVSQRFWPGGVGVSRGWRPQLQETARMIGERGPVWARFDNAYYSGEVVEFCRERGWDYSISVTNKGYKRPLKEILEAFGEEDWTAINDDGTEHAAFLYYQPAGWAEEQIYVVVRSQYRGSQKLLWPRYIFIAVSRDDLPLAELVKRHRGKQGQENAFKGPLIDLDLHHPPCWKYNANRAFYLAGQLAQNLLIAVQFRLLPVQARLHSLRTVIRDLIRIPGKLVRHAGVRTLRFAKTAFRLDWIVHAADRLAPA